MFKKLFITDKLVIYYVLFCMVWIGLGRNSIENPQTLFYQYCYVFGYIWIVMILQHFIQNPVIRFIRYWYPLTLIGFFFSTSTQMHFVIFKDFLDPFFQHIDYVIFGYQPALIWGTALDNFFVQEFFHFAYFSYYLMIIGVPLYVYLKHEKTEFIRVLYNLMFVFISCYIIYIFLPVVGGRNIPGIKELTETYRHGMFTHIMAYLYQNVNHWGGAFPSSHVAIAFTITFLSFRYLNLFSWVLILNTIFLSISTVECHYHYFIDAIAGVAFGLIMFGISEIIYTISIAKSKRWG